MRVLHVISGIDPSLGGPATAVAALATAQRRTDARLDVDVVSSFYKQRSDTVVSTLKECGVKVAEVGPIRGVLRRDAQLSRVLDEAIAVADIVHIHGLWEQIQHLAARSAHRQCKPYIFRPCGMLDPWSLSQGRWKKKLYMMLRLRADLNAAAALHFTSDLERDLTAPLHLRAPSIVEPNGIPLEEFDPLPPRGRFRERHPELAGRGPLLLFLSRIHHKKGLDLLIPALARLKHRDAVLAIAGPDAEGYAATVRDMIDKHNVKGRVIFTGMLRGAERIAALVDADLFVLPSYQENFGIAVVEALAAGTPVVISDQVNIYREIAAAGVGGVVPTRAEPLAEEIDRWLDDESLRRAAAARAGPFVREHYDWNEIARRWAGHYQSIVGATAATRRE